MIRLRLVLAVLIAAVLSGVWFLSVEDSKAAEDPPPKGTLPANWKKLGLTDDQVKKVYTVQAEYRTKIAKLQQQIKDLQQQERAEMEKVLTDAQKARLKEIREGTTTKDG